MEDKNKRLSLNLVTSELSASDKEKILTDLGFIQEIAANALKINCRVVVSGGYANDGALGQITRPHGDIDLQVYGIQDDANVLIKRIVEESSKNIEPLNLEDRGRETYYHAFKAKGKKLTADIYYVRVVTDPFSNQKIVLKNDGIQNEKQYFNTSKVALEGVAFEAVNPDEGLRDITGKREGGYGIKEKHDQDIINLRALISQQKFC
jgi:hypothetical protein